jgi:hypothetical protein
VRRAAYPPKSPWGGSIVRPLQGVFVSTVRRVDRRGRVLFWETAYSRRVCVAVGGTVS